MDIRDLQRSKRYASVKGFLSKPLTSEMIDDIEKAKQLWPKLYPHMADDNDYLT